MECIEYNAYILRKYARQNRKIYWYETYKIDQDIESDILNGIDTILKEYKQYKQNKKQ